MTAFARSFALKQRPEWDLPKKSIWLGAVAPDIPLYFLGLGGYFYYTRIQGWTRQATFQHMFGTLYFEHPFWIASHNFLHAPLIVLGGMVLGKRMRSKVLYYFFMACALHSVVDILTHHDDGPVLAFPLNWTYRFSSPISYWDPAHYGRYFSVFEMLLNLFFMAYLLAPLVKKWKQRHS